MSKPKTVQIEVNDVFEELKEENNRLSKQLLFAEKCFELFEKFRNCLNSYNNNCKCITNSNNKLIYNYLENEYKSVSEEYEKQIRNNVKSIKENFKENKINKIVLNKVSVNQRLSKSKIEHKIKAEIDSDSDSDEDYSDFDTNEEPMGQNLDTNNEFLNSSLNKTYIKNGCDSSKTPML